MGAPSAKSSNSHGQLELLIALRFCSSTIDLYMMPSYVIPLPRRSKRAKFLLLLNELANNLASSLLKKLSSRHKTLIPGLVAKQFEMTDAARDPR